jgi:hypothetical protein
VAEKQLSLNQQIALLPAAIPDSLLDFLEDFLYVTPLQTETSRASFDPEYLKAEEAKLQETLLQLRKDLGALLKISVEAGGRETPGAYLMRLGFEKGEKGIGAFTRLKERTILKLVFQEGAYDEEGLKGLLKNPK